MHKRGNIWQVRDAKGNRISTGTSDEGTAKALEAKFRQEKWSRKHMPELWREIDSRPKHTLKEACVKWLDEHQHQRGVTANGAFFRFWIDRYGEDCLLGDITRINADEFIKYRVSESPSKRNATANNYLTALKKVLVEAATVWNSRDDPWYTGYVPSFKFYKVLEPRDRVLSVDEWEALYAALEPDLQDIAKFALGTMLRQNNVLSLTPNHIRDRAVFFKSEEMKNGHPHSIPLNETAQSVLERRLKDHAVIGTGNIFLFHMKPYQGFTGTCYRAWLDAVKRAGLPPVTFHDLRRTATSWLAMKGVPAEVRMRMGAWHRKGTMQNFYTHYEVDSLRPWIHKIDTILGESKANQVVTLL